MNSNRILTRKTTGLDNRVWWVMLTMIVLSTALLSYRLMDDEPCLPVSVTIKTILHHPDKAYFSDEIISFNVLGEEKILTWDFDDNSPKQQGRYVTHRFKREGNFNIKIITRNGCETIQPITIKKSPDASPGIDANNLEEKISGHATTLVGVTENFYAMIKADAYEWNVLQHPKYLPRSGDSTQYSFTEPGDYTIELTLNNDRSKKFRKIVHVDDLPKLRNEGTEKVVALIPVDGRIRNSNGNRDPQNIDPLIDKTVTVNTATTPVKVEPVKKKIMFISNETFLTFLESVLNNQKELTDFNQYLFFEGATKVQVNGEKEFKTFSWLYQELKGKNKKVKLKSVELVRDENENVFNIKIEYKKKKGIFGL